MKAFYQDLGLEVLCGLLGKTRQAFYDHRRRQDRQIVNESLLVELVREQRKQTPGIGGRKLFYLLEDEIMNHHFSIGRDRFFEVLGKNDLLIRRRKKYATTTQSRHWLKKYPNLTENRPVDKPEQLWVSDITYLYTDRGFCYLTLITDAYSRKIVGYKLSPSLHATFCVEALKDALKERMYPDHELMHHSDRGLQYCSMSYTELLKKHNVLISMTQNGDPYENAMAERINGILKQEWKLDQTFNSFEHAQQTVHTAIHQYNQYRPHASCDYLTPSQAHQKTGTLPKRWKPKVKERKSVSMPA